MEMMNTRSESPFSRNKAKSQLSNASENGSMVIEQIQNKKKGLKNKCKSQQNGKDNENIENDGKDSHEEENSSISEKSDNSNSNNTEFENAINNGDNIENSNGAEEVEEEIKENKDDALINVCDTAEEYVSNEFGREINDSVTAEESKSTENITGTDYEEDNLKQNSCTKTLETETCIKKDNLPSSDSLPDSNTVSESFEEKPAEEENTFNGDPTITQELEVTAESLDKEESSQISINGDEVNGQSEPTQVVEDPIQAFPDTATKNDNSFSNKITNFFGKLSYSHDKQDSEVSSSKKVEEALIHPYLSKVSGRRGIKDRLNLSATVFSSREMDVKTPENSRVSLDDSFRVRTNPPRLKSSDIMENPTLRKFKGKRCLNAGDEPEEGEDLYYNTMKRQKLDEKAQEPGLWGSILWRSPFKKKQFDDVDELKLSTNESKLSRLLSPFWFWKKTVAGQREK